MIDEWPDYSHVPGRAAAGGCILVGRSDAIACAGEVLPQRHVTALIPVGDGGPPLRSAAAGGAHAPMLGRREDIARIVLQCGANQVLIVVSPDDEPWLADLIAELAALPVQVRLLPRPPATGVLAEPLDNAPDKAAARLAARVVKRTLDLVAGSAALVLCAPLMALVALAIRLDTPGPAIFRQLRVGQGGLLFPMLKFRSMTAGAGATTPGGRDRTATDGRPRRKAQDDERVTRVGRLIRRTSLDELPQLVNVVLGQMALVGPRPEVPHLMPYYTPEHWLRFSVPQGMTGWWQVNGRAEKPIYGDPADDLYYVRHCSLRLDLLILWKTIGAVIGGRGAF